MCNYYVFKMKFLNGIGDFIKKVLKGIEMILRLFFYLKNVEYFYSCICVLVWNVMNFKMFYFWNFIEVVFMFKILFSIYIYFMLSVSVYKKNSCVIFYGFFNYRVEILLLWMFFIYNKLNNKV